ncbi:MAG TPA: TIGR03435 family protein, partial [Acidobacteriaceae bacterium]|nr:TIGR03435 family protein [Acidobacteriaceae bacterium]
MRPGAVLLFYATLLSATHAVTQTHPAFEVASIHPCAPGTDPRTGQWSIPEVGRFNAIHLSLTYLIQLAWDMNTTQIVNAPDWLSTALFDISAKPEDGVRLTRDELRPRLQNLLQQRFHLVAHTETRSTDGYVLVVSKTCARLTPTKADHFPGFRRNVSSGHMSGFNWTMPQFAKYLTPAAGAPVVDQTGLTGSYDIDFTYNPKPDSDSPLPDLNE